MNRRHGAWGLWVVVGLTCCRPAEARDKVAHPTARKVKHQQGEDDVGPTLPRARVLLEDVSGGVHAVDVEVAATPDTRSRGLMWRKELPEGQGMLFIFPDEEVQRFWMRNTLIFPDEEVQRFWMRNTLIALDMIFINSAGRVVGIIENAAPRSLVQRFVREPGRYVLEVPGGWSRKVGLERGAHVRFEGVERIPVIP